MGLRYGTSNDAVRPDAWKPNYNPAAVLAFALGGTSYSASFLLKVRRTENALERCVHMSDVIVHAWVSVYWMKTGVTWKRKAPDTELKKHCCSSKSLAFRVLRPHKL